MGVVLGCDNHAAKCPYFKTVFDDDAKRYIKKQQQFDLDDLFELSEL